GPTDEQNFIIREVNQLMASPDWSSTAIVIAYDDSDGWYDHAFAPITNSSHDAAQDSPLCTDSTAPVLANIQDRCGPGPRLPMLVLSPYTRANTVDHSQTEQTSIIRFIEDNWSLPRIGNGSYDERARSIASMLNFDDPSGLILQLNDNGTV